MALTDGLRKMIRAAVGLPLDPGEPPDLMRLGLYRARVDKCASDGSKLDVTPSDARISPEKNVTLLAGVPGAVATMSPGAIVLLGWERGDPAKPYCVPCWEQGATVTKLVLKATTVYLGEESGAVALVTKTDFDSHTHLFTGPSGPVGAPTAPAVGTTKVKAV